MSQDHTQRFSDRVANYIKYRPGYPPGILPYLQTTLGLTPAARIADIGSGTGILSELFLQHGNPVWGVEPNQPMRAAAEELLSRYPAFTSVDGRAEATGLPAHSFDFVTAGQAFHWFDPAQAKTEFTRLLRPGGSAILIWNIRDQSYPLVYAYEDLLRTYGTDYVETTHLNLDKNHDLAAFFSPHPFHTQSFPNQQPLDLAGFTGRLLSASYTPTPGHPNYAPFLSAAQAVFDQHQANGQVTMHYLTHIYSGPLAP